MPQKVTFPGPRDQELIYLGATIQPKTVVPLEARIQVKIVYLENDSRKKSEEMKKPGMGMLLRLLLWETRLDSTGEFWERVWNCAIKDYPHPKRGLAFTFGSWWVTSKP